MDTNITVAIVSASSAVVVAITALILNTFWVRYAIEKQGTALKTEIDGTKELLRAELKGGFDAQAQALLRVEGILDARLKQVEETLKLR